MSEKKRFLIACLVFLLGLLSGVAYVSLQAHERFIPFFHP